jgi:hypothetical protein
MKPLKSFVSETRVTTTIRAILLTLMQHGKRVSVLFSSA